jgi:hypothetical protein
VTLLLRDCGSDLDGGHAHVGEVVAVVLPPVAADGQGARRAGVGELGEAERYVFLLAVEELTASEHREPLVEGAHDVEVAGDGPRAARPVTETRQLPSGTHSWAIVNGELLFGTSNVPTRLRSRAPVVARYTSAIAPRAMSASMR